MEWDFKNGIPIYLQIVDAMTMRIASGEYEPGSKLPSVRDLALDAGVNPNTMQRALSELERKGIVYTERTSGRFISDDKQVLKSLHGDLATAYIEELAEKLTKIGMDKKEISEALRKWIEEAK